ncbi:hypothetical protein SCLCIDRAFT_1223652 [Scleroderma citrinum Foug A]|uniref:Uncharacterized protein n=1 Tax=Scleroderma citrinum Foug A TaxID=1036808 RepID=A0A0C2ZIJ3_9AGAM|nr:hypothetical protein SCLCIDRAFT_1223652 [Scleroderma citrinum Foug A]
MLVDLDGVRDKHQGRDADAEESTRRTRDVRGRGKVGQTRAWVDLFYYESKRTGTNKQ